MYYGDSYFSSQSNPFAVQQPQQQQQQGMQINPMQALQAYNMFSGGGAAGGASGGGGMGGLTSMFGGGGAASGGAASSGAAAGGSGASGATSALASNPIGWIAAAALAQNVAHNKDIASWQSALKGQAGGNIGSHFMDQWGVDEDSKIRDVAGVLGWDKEGGGVLNPNYLSKKIFGSVD